MIKDGNIIRSVNSFLYDTESHLLQDLATVFPPKLLSKNPVKKHVDSGFVSRYRVLLWLTGQAGSTFRAGRQAIKMTMSGASILGLSLVSGYLDRLLSMAV